jgi:hypothetical protein
MKKQVADPKKIKASSRNRDSFIACSGFCVICTTMKKRSLKNSSLINHDGSMKPLFTPRPYWVWARFKTCAISVMMASIA